MDDPRILTLEEIATHYNQSGNTICTVPCHALEGTNEGDEIILVPYGGSESDYVRDDHYHFRAQIVSQNFDHKLTINTLWRIWEDLKNNFRNLTTTYRIHHIRALDQPGAVAKGQNNFWATANVEILIDLT